jgi:hypothetical protein
MRTLLLMWALLDTSGSGRTYVTESYDVLPLCYVDDSEILSCLIDPMHPRNHGLDLWTSTNLENFVRLQVFGRMSLEPSGRLMKVEEGRLIVRATPSEQRKIRKVLDQERMRRLLNKGP